MRMAFVLGVMRRSGTNYLHDLLSSHPACSAAAIPEDFFVSELEQLDWYGERVARHWNPSWWNGEPRAAIRVELGRAVARLAVEGTDEPVDPSPGEAALRLVKTPSVSGLRHLRGFFPTVPVVFIVRDGRAVVESGIRSFGWWNFDVATSIWAAAVDEILTFLDRDADTGLSMMVRYEDMVADTKGEMERLLRFLGLSVEDYPFAAAEALPVRGSSELAAEGVEALHWKGVARHTDFSPLGRFQDWSSARHARFNHLAGHQSRALGYTLVERPMSGWSAAAYNGAKDLRRWLSRRAWRQRLARLVPHPGPPGPDREIGTL